MSSKVEQMERVINALRSGSDLQASTLLARLRLGERVDDVANSLPTSASSMPESGSVAIQESTYTLNETAGRSPLRHDSSASHASSIGHRTTWTTPGSATTSLRSTGKAKLPAAPGRDAVEDHGFLSLLFDRHDYLLAISESEDEGDFDTDFDQIIDPKLWIGGGSGQGGSPMDLTASRLPSPDKSETVRSIHVTHLRSRQPIVKTIRVHPNLDIHNMFGNLPFSSSVRANNLPVDVQETTVQNLFLPTWAMMTVSTRPDPGSVKYAFPAILQEATVLLESGTPVDTVIEKHPNIAALFDESEFNRSGILSRWTAGMVHSVMLKGNDFTCFAYMYLFWYLMRWMISPSPETYELMPEWLRPTPNQLFMPHINMLDYVPWPAFRELAVQIPAMQERMEWLLDMSDTLRCDWSFPAQEALGKVDETGFVDLCDSAKTSLRDLSNWSLGPSFRGYVSNADSYVRIRVEEF
ncbi:uncharacterized protein EKO05_0010785 [Ascochyta rabiei]|uniref:uncharacterized protein n=1 Tax=Didymella rabiei TaxID=5454 RepID=UPI00220E9F00|nr:uncharacterized protein EKO05_0010785 [Ascochyta rabiei]UPX20557.1 hypothetical protein EKO05_0010785 [Ascochyta rabiei]